jgi:hypothetical protein
MRFVSLFTSVAEDIDGILMETLAGGIPQVGCQVKIVVSGHGINMAHISSQVGKFSLDFNPLLIPPVQGGHGETMP